MIFAGVHGRKDAYSRVRKSKVYWYIKEVHGRTDPNLGA